MAGYFIAPIVEGHGEVQAVPVLIRRIFHGTRSDTEIEVNPALRVKAQSFLTDGAYRSKYIELAARKAKPHERGIVLVLLDCEDDCPAQLGPKLKAAATGVRSDVPILIALAHREYETWFLAAAKSLRGVAGLPGDLESPDIPEAIRDAKGWLAQRMPVGYNAPNDQLAFTNCFSLPEAATIPSFARLHRKLSDFFAK